MSMLAGKLYAMGKLFFIHLFLLSVLISSVYATGPILDSVNDLSSVDQTQTDPAGNTVNSLITGHITVPNNFPVLDDFEDSTDDATAWGGPWYVFSDTSDNGTSRIDAFVVTDSAGYSNTKGLKLGYTLGDSLGPVGEKYGPNVSIGLEVKEIPLNNPTLRQQVRDLSGVTKFKYYYKGPAHTFHVITRNITDFDTYHAIVPAKANWSEISLNFTTTDFKQEGWGNAKPLKKDSVQGFIWNVSGKKNDVDTIYLDNFSVEAGFPDPGIAVVMVDNSGVGGKWQYKTGSSWSDFGTGVSDSTARLINNTALVRFAPDNSGNGVPSITVRGWDLSEGRANGSIANTKRVDTTDQTVWSEIPRVASVTIGGPPEITVEPRDTTVLENTTGAFSLTATGTAPLSYNWQKNDNGWGNITNATSPTYTFTALLSDSGRSYRCVVSNSYGTDTSVVVVLKVLHSVGGPNITAPSMNDTIIGENQNFSFGTAKATGNPPPTFKWFYMQTPSSIPDSVGEGADFLIQNTDQADEGYYFIVAANSEGTDTSDTAYLDVYADPVITKDLDSTKSLLDNTPAYLKIAASGEGTLKYQWYKNGNALSGQTDDSLFLGTVTIATHHDSTYYCNVWNSTASVDTVGGVVSSTVCTLKVGKYSNPFELVAARLNEHDTSQVVLTISSSQDLTEFPTGDNQLIRYAEHVWILYQTKDFPGDTGDVVEILKYTTLSIKQDADNSITDTITVQPYAPGEELHCFSNTIFWVDPAATDTLFPLVNKQHNKVFLGDTVSPDNNLTLSGEYSTGTDNATITVGNTLSLSDTRDSVVVFQCSDYSDFSSIFSSAQKSISELKSGGDTCTFTMKVGTVPFETKTVYSRCRVIGKNTAASAYRNTSFTAGQKRPEYLDTLHAFSTTLSDAVKLTWDLPDPGTDSVLIWFSTDSIPIGEYSIPLPQGNAHGVKTTALLVDTVRNLTPLTRYYFSLQILRDGLWSKTTDPATDTATTGQPDSTLLVPNTITIDSAWFDTTRNAINVSWRVDTGITPEGAWLQYGYTYSVDPDTSYKDPNSSPSWSKVTGTGGTYSFSLDYDIVFDTTYTVGMWLRAQNDSATGPNAPPGDSVACTVTIPPFTWQPIIFTSGGIDMIYAANQKILLQGTVSFDYKDTLYAFNPGTLPNGFVDIGGVPFTFKGVNTQLPPILLGMKWGQLPTGITKDDIGLYQYINGELHVVYGFTISNGAVWDTLTNKNMGSPFLILADTLAPVVTLTECSDTVYPKMIIPTRFTISDNIANVQWQLVYGPGNEGYGYGIFDTMSATFDSLKAIITVTANVINESFGVRALVIAGDGVTADTTDVSRCVYTDQVGIMSVPKMEWVPLRTPAGLDEPDLAAIFDKSITQDQGWEYDIYRYRLYCWDNINPDEDNNWIEYSNDVKDNFTFVPGRLIWFKSAESQSIKLGSGNTTSLKEPYGITLKAKNWTDISLPFQFKILLRDVLETTGSASDSLEVYQWIKDGSIYDVLDLYVAKMDDVEDVKDTLKPEQKHDGYTVYNHTDSPVTLLIPPVSLPLSNYLSRGKKEVCRNKDSWNVHFKWTREVAGEDRFYRRIRCGYKKSGKEIEYGLYPPTMSTVRVGVVNSTTDKLCGWALEHELDKQQGVNFTIGIRNRSPKKTSIEYFLANLEVLPQNYQAKILNTGTKQYETCTEESPSVITLDADEHTSRVLVVGTRQYLNHMLAAFLPIKLLKAFPNPFNGRVTIHYRIPAHIKEVTFTLFNVRGQTLWQGIERKHLAPGEHMISFNGKNSTGSPLSAGVYIMRLTAKNDAGKAVYGGEKRITCIK